MTQKLEKRVTLKNIPSEFFRVELGNSPEQAQNSEPAIQLRKQAIESYDNQIVLLRARTRFVSLDRLYLARINSQEKYFTMQTLDAIKKRVYTVIDYKDLIELHVPIPKLE